MTRLLVSSLLWVLVCLAPPAAFAQEASQQDPPAHISFVDGAAVLERDGQSDSNIQSMPLLAGDRVRTQGGRVEVLFADGSALHLDANTVVDFQSDDVVRLLEGRIRLSVAGPARDIRYRVDAPAAWVQIADPGEYRIGVLRDGEVELAVLRGSAELVNDQGRSAIRAGERTFARNGAAPSPPYVFNSAAWDSFDRWSEARRDQRLGVSAQYLPNDVRRYAPVFDSYGSWQYQQTYGYVWYPRVDVAWRPYYHGRWASLRPYGWTWIAGDAWGWPTHHYGRWGFSAGAWFWIPGRTWGPAWVSWGYSPTYVSWCPLGWNNRAVIVNVNHYGYGRGYNAWHGWTAVPRHHFAGPYVNVRNAGVVRIDDRNQASFVVRDSAPATRYAAGRSAAAIHSAGRYAVPRNGSSAASALAAQSATRDVGAGTGGERRFPAPARAPRTAGVITSDRNGQTQGAGSRAVARDSGAASVNPDNASATARSRQSSAAVSAGAASQYQRTPDAGVRQRRESDSVRGATVTEAPAGAVRAVPRARGAAQVDPSAEHQRSRSYSAPSYSAPSSPAPSYSAPSYSTPGAAPNASSPQPSRSYRPRETQPSVSQPAPAHRSAPEPSYRQAPEPRPSYRSAPEGRAPSGPPPSAAPSRSGGEHGGGGSGGGGGGGRQRSGDAAPSGSARRR